ETRKKCGCSCSVPGCSCGARKQPYLSNHRDEGPESVDFVSGSTIRRLKSGAVPSLFPYTETCCMHTRHTGFPFTSVNI
uniref:Uncharacterized protein n=1 Tax=Gouania willdenowi TaxID=441366 RepID=A0A8C5HZK9_GOUWI